MEVNRLIKGHQGGREWVAGKLSYHSKNMDLVFFEGYKMKIVTKIVSCKVCSNFFIDLILEFVVIDNIYNDSCCTHK